MARRHDIIKLSHVPQSFFTNSRKISGKQHLLISKKKDKLKTKDYAVILNKKKDGDEVTLGFRDFTMIKKVNLSDIEYERVRPEPKPCSDPKLRLPSCSVYKGDCVGVLEGLVASQEASYNIALFSPPYNSQNETNPHGYPDKKPEDEYVEMFVKVFNLLDKLMCVSGTIIMNIDPFGPVSLFYRVVSAIQTNTPWTATRDISWDRPYANPRKVNGRYEKHKCEHVVIFDRKTEKSRKVRVSDQKQWKKLGERFPGWGYYITDNIFKTDTNNDAERIKQISDDFNYNNKATFPSEVVRKLLTTYARVGDHIIDPFMGSGTVGEVCAEANLSFTGIDSDDRACEVVSTLLSSYTKENINPCTTFDVENTSRPYTTFDVEPTQMELYIPFDTPGTPTSTT